MPVSRGHIAAAPRSRQRNAILRRDQPGVGRDERVVAQVVLVDPKEAVATQGRSLRADERPRARIAGLGEQDCAKAGRQIDGSRRTFCQVRERAHAVGSCRDLQQDLRQVHARHARFNFPAQRDQRRRLLELVERAEHEFLLAGDGLEANVLVVREPGRHDAVGCVQLIGKQVKCWRGLGTQAERSADDGSSGLPFSAGEKAGARVRIAPARGDKNVATADGHAQFVQSAEGEGWGIDAAVVANDVMRPRLVDDRNRGLVVGAFAQPIQGLQQGLCGGVGVELNDAQQRRQKPRDSRRLGGQLPIEHVVVGAHQAGDVVQCLRQFVASDRVVHQSPQLAIG